jgi:hypothetical protein
MAPVASNPPISEQVPAEAASSGATSPVDGALLAGMSALDELQQSSATKALWKQVARSSAKANALSSQTTSGAPEATRPGTREAKDADGAAAAVGTPTMYQRCTTPSVNSGEQRGITGT